MKFILSVGYVWRECGPCRFGLWAAHSFSLAAPLQSVSRCGGERTERSDAPWPRICSPHTKHRDSHRAAGRQEPSGAAWSCESCRATGTRSPQITVWFIYLPNLRAFLATWRPEAAGCYWLHTSSSLTNKVSRAAIHVLSRSDTKTP